MSDDTNDQSTNDRNSGLGPGSGPGPGFDAEADAGNAARRAWLSTLAKAPLGDIEAAWARLDARPDYDFLRRPEVGLVMVRGRAGGGGHAFNMGEMTVSRSTVRLACGRTGVGYVAGRSTSHAELMAVLDALLQDPRRSPEVARTVIEPLARSLGERRDRRRAEVAASKVEFFTMVRGED